MHDAELLRSALEALRSPALDSRDLQGLIAARRAEIYAVGGAPAAPAGEPSLGATIPTLQGR